MPHAAVRVVLFDLDETLIVEAAAVRTAMLRVVEPVATARGVAPEDLVDAVRTRARASWKAHPLHPWMDAIGISSWECLCAPFRGESEEVAVLREWAPSFRRDAWHAALIAADHDEADLAERLADTFPRVHGPLRRPYPEVPGLLATLHVRYRLGLITNGLACLQGDKVESAGLRPWFDVVTISGTVGAGKPDPLPFRRTLEALGAGPEEAVMVGDNPARDVAGARALGIRTVLVDRRGDVPASGARADVVVRDLCGLPAILAAWSTPPPRADSSAGAG